MPCLAQTFSKLNWQFEKFYSRNLSPNSTFIILSSSFPPINKGPEASASEPSVLRYEKAPQISPRGYIAIYFSLHFILYHI